MSSATPKSETYPCKPHQGKDYYIPYPFVKRSPKIGRGRAGGCPRGRLYCGVFRPPRAVIATPARAHRTSAKRLLFIVFSQEWKCVRVVCVE